MPELTVDRLREVLDYNPETGVFVNRKLGRPVGCRSKHLGYWIVTVTGHGQFYAHRLAWLYVHGEWPKFIDHINLDKMDNRLCNLRNVEQRINNQNKRDANKNNIAGFLGVSYDARNASPWVARIWVDGRSKHIKACKTKEEAHEAYIAAKRKIHEGCTL
jgi:phosphoribosyl-ATP pyrophosphohydrolase